MFQYWPLNRALHLAAPVVTPRLILKGNGRLTVKQYAFLHFQNSKI